MKARNLVKTRTGVRSGNKKMMKRFISGLVVALGLASAGNAAAQEILLTGPLAGAPAVRKERLYRGGRFEIAPTISFTLLDEYQRTIFVGGRLQYNITEWLAIGAWGAFGAVQSPTSLTNEINDSAPRNGFTVSQVNHGPATSGGNYQHAPFADQTAKMNWVIAPQLQLTPFRGKLSLFQKIFVDTDAYLHAGVAFVGIQERADCGGGNGQPPCVAPLAAGDASSFTLASTTKIAPTFGIGLNFYLTDFMSLGLEYRALPFSWNRSGFDTRGAGNNQNFPDGKINSQDDTFKFNQMMTISIGFSLPPKEKISD
jgi:outer membrane beta-barrel protein